MKKLQNYIFILLLILLPMQLGRHFWPEWSYVSGVRVDYLSPTLYLTDVLVLLLLLLEIYNFQFSFLNQFSKHKFSIFIFSFLIASNVYFSLSPAASVYKWLKVAEFGWLAYFVAKNNRLLLNSFRFLLIPVLYESVLAIWQWWQQGSVGGIWYWLGERTFNSGTPGIANTYINGQLWLRPYGTFSHPNVLGGFLAVVLPFILYYFLHNSRRINVLGKWGGLGILGLGFTTLLLSMSRTAILVGTVATLWVLRRKVILFLIPLLLLWPRLLIMETEPAVARGELNRVAIQEFMRSPLWGTGLGTAPMYNLQFTIYNLKNYALAFQPTHNIYLLLLAETGILGILGGLGLLGIAIKRKSIPLLSILVLGFFDHYFLTLQQGQLLFALAVGMMIKIKTKEVIA